MRTLYESILDDDNTIIQNTKNAVLYKVEEFLKKFFYAKFCKFDIVNDRLVVTCTKDYTQYRRFDFCVLDDIIIDLRNPTNQIEKKLLDYVDFVKCDIYVTYANTPEFLKHCTKCTIQLEGDGRFDKETAEYLKQSRDCTVVLSGIKAGSYIYDFSRYSGMDFSNHHLVISQTAIVADIKGVSAKSILFQPTNKWKIEDTSNIIDADMDSDYFYECLDKFVTANPDIKALGIINHHVQYATWYIKQADKWTHKSLGTNIKRVPKVR